MPGEVQALLAMVRDFQKRAPLEEMLQGIADRTARLVDAQRVSLRLFDVKRERLLAVARAGAPLHRNVTSEFKLGEGLVGWIAQHGEPIRTTDADHDPRFAARPDLKGPIGSYLGVPLLVDRACIGVLAASDPSRKFSANDEDLLSLVAGLCAPHIEIVRRIRLEQVDELTGVLNHRGLELALPDLSLVSIVVVDIDRFSKVNEQHGRKQADELLKRIAKILASALRGGDTLLRLEEDEFLMALPATDLARAATLAEEARSGLARCGMPLGNTTARFTLSAGVAARKPNETRDALLARARAALAEAKQAGRNCVRTAGD